MNLIDLLTGEYGGLMALAFGMGCAAGWAFATRTALAEARRIAKEYKDERDEFRSLWQKAQGKINELD